MRDFAKEIHGESAVTFLTKHQQETVVKSSSAIAPTDAAMTNSAALQNTTSQ